MIRKHAGKERKKLRNGDVCKDSNEKGYVAEKCNNSPARLTFALVPMPIQLRTPRRMRVPIAIIRAKGTIAGMTTLRYSIPERQLIAAVRK